MLKGPRELPGGLFMCTHKYCGSPPPAHANACLAARSALTNARLALCYHNRG